MSKCILAGTCAMVLSIAFVAGCDGQQSGAIAAPRTDWTALRKVLASSFSQKLVVANSADTGSSPMGVSGILAFGLPSAGGDVAPTQNISGNQTHLSFNHEIAVGPAEGNIFSDNLLQDNVYRFTKNAQGNVSPLTLDIGSYGSAVGIAIDTSGDVWIGTFSPTSILEFASGAHGNAVPINVISGSNAQLGSQGVSLAFDTSGNIWAGAVAPGSGNRLVEFPPTASGNATPIRTIQGSNTKLGTPLQIAFDNSTSGDGRIVVASDSDVLIFAANASGNAKPLQDITTVANPGGVAVDAQGHIYVSASRGNKIYEFASNANGDATPILKIVGPDTQLDVPEQLAIEPF